MCGLPRVDKEGPLNVHDDGEKDKHYKLKGLHIIKKARSVFFRKYSPLELVELSLIELYKALNGEKRKEKDVSMSILYDT